MYLLFSGFRGSYRPPAPPTHGLEDNVPDVHDEADFDIPDTQAVLERFMTRMSKLADVEYQVQGPGELRCKDRVSYCCHIISIYLLYTLYFIAPSRPSRSDQAVNAHTTRARTSRIGVQAVRVLVRVSAVRGAGL